MYEFFDFTEINRKSQKISKNKIVDFKDDSRQKNNSSKILVHIL